MTALLLWLTLACGDIEAPDTVRVHEPLVARVVASDIPEGARLRGSFSVAGGSYVQCGDDTFHVWAPPGRVLLRARGVWILTRDVIVDGQTFPVLIDFGQYSFEKAITVGEAPGPDPPVPPPPPGERWAVIWYESSQQTPQQAALFAKLRQEFQSERLLILDVSQLPPKWEAWRAKLAPTDKLPALMVVAGNQLLRVVPLPSSVAGVKEAIAK